jgi:hypothetical protein
MKRESATRSVVAQARRAASSLNRETFPLTSDAQASSRERDAKHRRATVDLHRGFRGKGDDATRRA